MSNASERVFQNCRMRSRNSQANRSMEFGIALFSRLFICFTPAEYFILSTKALLLNFTNKWLFWWALLPSKCVISFCLHFAEYFFMRIFLFHSMFNVFKELKNLTYVLLYDSILVCIPLCVSMLVLLVRYIHTNSVYTWWRLFIYYVFSSRIFNIVTLVVHSQFFFTRFCVAKCKLRNKTTKKSKINKSSVYVETKTSRFHTIYEKREEYEKNDTCKKNTASMVMRTHSFPLYAWIYWI